MVSVRRPGDHIHHIPGIGVTTSRRAVASATFAGTNFFTQPYTGTRNNYTGQLGYKFTTASAFTVIALGRSISNTMAASHTVKLWKVTPYSLLASAIVTPSSLVDALGFAYELLASSVALVSGAEYYLASTEAAGGDAWRDNGSLSGHSALASINTGIYTDALNDTPPFSTYGASENGYIPVTFYT